MNGKILNYKYFFPLKSMTLEIMPILKEKTAVCVKSYDRQHFFMLVPIRIVLTMFQIFCLDMISIKRQSSSFVQMKPCYVMAHLVTSFDLKETNS